MRRKDNLLGYNSGLDVFQAIQVINMSARECFHNMFIEFLMKGGGSIPTETAAKIAKDLAVGIYSSIASKIDPLELGEKNRAMKIASSYGEKLNSISQNNNMKQDTLNKLISDYPSHGFVIDMQQAKELFKNVENMTEMDYYLFKAFQKNFENPSEVFCLDLESIRNSLEKEEKNVDVCRGGDELSSSNKREKEKTELTPKSQNDDFTESYWCKVDECLISRALNQGNELTYKEQSKLPVFNNKPPKEAFLWCMILCNYRTNYYEDFKKLTRRMATLIEF